MASLLAGVKSGQLYQGHFNANQYNYLEVGVHLSSYVTFANHIVT